jgi:FtsP/CotA-like multicopper oxidase with cupredoxin domain
MGQFDINTDYEALRPQGIVREYTLTASDWHLNTDGQDFNNAKVFNHQYPGPWIQACWGDVLKINVLNNLTYNGTSIHWHGLRQLDTMHMDGVPGVTQCPIAPNDSYTYVINTTQYGSSWYHSHYSVQYADGLAGPIVRCTMH